MTRSTYEHSRWPSTAPDPAAAALAELAKLVGSVPGEWADRGTCRDSRDDIHFPTGAETSPGFRLAAAIAKRECAGCPVVAECLAHAIEHQEPHGVWGGTTPAERRDLIRRDRDQRRAS